MIQRVKDQTNINQLAKACAPWVNAADPHITTEELDNEIWCVVPSAPEYEASSLGRVRREGILMPQGHRGTTTVYPSVYIRARHTYTHRVIAEAFLGPAGSAEVDHIDGNSFNNRASNLEYVSRNTNARRASQRLRAKQIGSAPWTRMYDAALATQNIQVQPGGCRRGHTAAEFGTRKDGTCRACKSAVINLQYDITRELMKQWYPQWTDLMAHGYLAEVVNIDKYRDEKAA